MFPNFQFITHNPRSVFDLPAQLWYTALWRRLLAGDTIPPGISIMSKDHSFCGPMEEPSLFARVGRLVATDNAIEHVLQNILEEAAKASGADRGFLAIVDHDRGELDVRYTYGQGWTEEKRLGRLKISEKTGKGITSHSAATRSPYRSDDVLNDPYYLMSFEDARSELAAPLVDNYGRARGVINLESLEYNHFQPASVCIVMGLADLATIAITMDDHRAREMALVQIGQELNRFSDTDALLQKVIDVAADALKFEDCSLFMIDVVTDKLVLRASRGPLAKLIGKASYDLGEGLTGWTAENEQILRVIDPPSDPRWKGLYQELPSSEVGAYMAVPIRIHRGVIGVIRVQRKKSPYQWFPNDFTDDDESILTTIAAQLGITLDNRRLIDQLVKTERMAAWGEMSARSAHMIGNRVFAIKGDFNELEWMLGQPNIDSQSALRISESIKKGIFLLEDILNEFREFVKATQLDIEEIDLNSLVMESIDEGFPRRSQTEIKTRIKADLPRISADPTMLKRCFGELMENSVNFQPEGGRITVTTGIADEPSKKWLRPSQQSGNFLMVRFEDNGPGIALIDKPKIFNPFYTSRAKGMGLGLSIVKGIVEAHDGVIFESGKPGKGAKFTILLPYEKTE
ncbi:MAG: GAF domain-containing protein [Armatimonadetes bacterium]|nr:GAF domain-containing protein [Armatimonadota bacterium]